MKRLTILLILLSQACFAQNPFSPFNDTKPKGPIDSVIISGNGEGKHLYIYNKQRQVTEATWYIDNFLPDGIGRVLDTVTTKFSYGADGKLASSTRIHKSGTGSVDYNYVTTKYGYAIRSQQTGGGDSVVNEFRFDHKGQLIQYGFYSLKDLEQRRAGNYDYNYDDRRNMIESVVFWSLSLKNPDRLFYKYNSDNDMIAVKYGDRKARQTDATYTYSKYDDMHNWTERIFTNGGGFSHTAYRRITYHK